MALQYIDKDSHDLGMSIMQIDNIRSLYVTISARIFGDFLDFLQNLTYFNQHTRGKSELRSSLWSICNFFMKNT